MASDFERARFEVSGHLVTVTSWYDNRTNTWSAGAPAYSYLFTRTEESFIRSLSRQDAMAKVVNKLTSYFKSTDSSQ